jgi:hypothetical protein
VTHKFFKSSFLALSLGLLSLSLVSTVALADDEVIATNVKALKSQIIPSPVLSDAPEDDFNRVAWCHGILSGHMDLAERIASQEPVSEMMQSIGASYLRTYEAALTLSAEGKTDKGRKSAEVARQKGFDGWEAARTADMDMAVGAYINWSLPGDCERATIAVSGKPDIFKVMQTDDEASLIADTLKPASERSRLDVFTPKRNEAMTAPISETEAISANSQAVAQVETKPKGNWADSLKTRLGWGKKKSEN